MKKKILLISLMVALIACLFAISISAATIYKDSAGNELFRYVDENADYDFDSYSGSFPKTDTDGNALTWYITATTTDGADTIHTVASLKTLGEAGNINASGAYSFTSPVTNKNTVSVNFPDNSGIKTWAFSSFGGYNSRKTNNILFVYCPNTLTAFANNPFQETQVIVVELDDETPITAIPQNFAHEARNLEKINIPATVTVINGNTSQNGTPFYNNKSLVKVTFASNDTLTAINGEAFKGCSALKEITLPVTVTTLARTFDECTSLEVVRLGASLEKTTAYSTFRKCENLKIYYIPATFTTINMHTFTNDSGTSGPVDTVFFYAGTRAQFDVFYNAAVSSGKNERVTSGYKEEYIVEWDSTKPDSYYTNLATTEGHKLYVVNYGVCEAFYGGIHELDPEKSNDCAGVCANCGKLSVSANPVHVEKVVITYEDLAKAGLKVTTCENENCTLHKEEALNAIFTYAGFSSDIATKEYICVGYMVDQDAYAEYKHSLGNKSISFGFVAAAIDYVNGATQLIGEDGNAIGNNVIQAPAVEIEDYASYNAFDFKLKGDFANEAYSSLKLGMALYTMIRETVNGEDVYTVNYVVADGESASKSVSNVEIITYAEKFPTQNEEVTE